MLRFLLTHLLAPSSWGLSLSRSPLRIGALTVPALTIMFAALAASATSPTELASAAPYAAPDGTARAVSVLASFDGFDPTRVDAELGEALEVTFTVVAFTGSFDLVFELDGGREERTPAIGIGRTESLEFNAPAEAGLYPYYSSVGDSRSDGYDGVLVVGGGSPLVVDAQNFSFDPSVIRADPGEWIQIVLNNRGVFHDIVFELGGDRVEATSRIMEGETEELLFRAPDVDGAFPYYCSVGSHRLNGMEGVFLVGDATPPPVTTPTATEGPGPGTTEPPDPTEHPHPTGTPTAPPAYEVVIDDLANPQGLAVHAEGRVLVSEGGTGVAVPGEFTPGNGDGRVLDISLDDPTDRMALISDMTNSLDPGGGVVGANHAISMTVEGSAGYTLVAQAGGPGHLRPEEAAKILKLVPGEEPVVLSDPLAYEVENNPDGAEGAGSIDSNPWRLVHGPTGDDHVYIVDAGGNDILKMDPETGELSTWAVFGPLDYAGAQQPIPTGLAFYESEIAGVGLGALVTLLGGFAPPGTPGYTSGQVRLLFDSNGDGDVLDDGENELLTDDVYLPTDIVVNSESGLVYVAELGRARIVSLNSDALFAAMVCVFGGGELATCFAGAGDRFDGVANGVPAVTGLALEADNSLLATTTGSPIPMEANLNPDRVIRLTADDFSPEDPDPEPTATPTEDPGPEPTDEPGTTMEIFLPYVLKQ